MCSICPHHECAHFWPFSAISYIFGSTCTMFSPPCRVDAWTNGPPMVCSLCTLVFMTRTPRGRTGAPTHEEVCQGEWTICHFGTCGYSSDHPDAMAHGGLWDPSTCWRTLDSDWVPHGILSPVSKPSWRNALGNTFVLAQFGVCQIIHFETRISASTCGQLAGPYL